MSSATPLLHLLPLLRGVALGRPGVDGGNLGLEDRVDEAVPRERVLALKLRGDDDGVEGLAAAAYSSEQRLVSGTSRNQYPDGYII